MFLQDTGASHRHRLGKLGGSCVLLAAAVSTEVDVDVAGDVRGTDADAVGSPQPALSSEVPPRD